MAEQQKKQSQFTISSIKWNGCQTGILLLHQALKWCESSFILHLTLSAASELPPSGEAENGQLSAGTNSITQVESAPVHKCIWIQGAGICTESCTKMAPHTQMHPKALHTFQPFRTQVARSALPGCNAYWQKKSHYTSVNQNKKTSATFSDLEKQTNMYRVYRAQHSPLEKHRSK